MKLFYLLSFIILGISQFYFVKGRGIDIPIDNIKINGKGNLMIKNLNGGRLNRDRYEELYDCILHVDTRKYYMECNVDIINCKLLTACDLVNNFKVHIGLSKPNNVKEYDNISIKKVNLRETTAKKQLTNVIGEKSYEELSDISKVKVNIENPLEFEFMTNNGKTFVGKFGGFELKLI